MNDDSIISIFALMENSVLCLIGLSVVFMIISAGLSLMKWVGVF